ncbi:HAAS signaling domain-containing protein [Paenibacillus arenilitoris]|uniref:DUF1700 domain-containing protein n=1 Tax=Paenibacillus arenilitoris TaxID=2772299 RepID=A0A927CLH9_9BACL|nr:DUF1700 domain-containing protein [Paenibacillus arenilitoris]MBD2868061.1 DUF1700 domain-containing protein [Paenibacillus arenilitoris]
MMTKYQYMSELTHLLKNVPEPIRKEWLYDYDMHFQLAAQNGQSEAEAALELGDPRTVAAELLLSYRVGQAETRNDFGGLSRAVFATVGMGLFNVIFVIGPYLGLAAVLLALWVSAGALAIAGIATVIESVWIGTFSYMQALSLGLICCSLSILSVLGLRVLTKLFFTATLKYLKFNTRIVRGKSQ